MPPEITITKLIMHLTAEFTSYIYTYMQCICNIIQFSLHSMKHEVCMKPPSTELADNLLHETPIDRAG